MIWLRKKLQAWLGVNASPNYDDWVEPTVGNERAYRERGLFTNHKALSFMGIQWVGICADFTATECANIPLRMYCRAGKGVGLGKNRRRVRDRKRLEYLRDRRFGAGKSAMYAERGDIEEIDDAYPLELLRKPNKFESGFEMTKRLVKSLQLAGNAYELIVEDEGSLQLASMLPQSVRVLPHDETLIEGYIYGRDMGAEVKYAPEAVVHHKLMPAMDNHWYGIGFLHNVVAESHVLAEAVAYELASMQNGMRPGDLAIEAGKETTASQVKQIQAELRRKYGGAKHAGTPLVLTDAKIVPITRTAKDMEYTEGMKRIKEITLASFGIPEALLSRSEGSIQIGGGGASQSAAYTVYARSTVLPILRGIAEDFNCRLLPRLGVDPEECWFAYDNPVPEDKAFEVEKAAKLVPLGVMTVNESREELDLAPIDGGDVARNPQQGTGGLFDLRGGLYDQRGGVHDLREQAGGDGGVFDLRKSFDPFGAKIAKKGKDVPVRGVGAIERAFSKFFDLAIPKIVAELDPLAGLKVPLFSIDGVASLFQVAVKPIDEPFVGGFNAEQRRMGLEPITVGAEKAGVYLQQYRGLLSQSLSESVDRKVKDVLTQAIIDGVPVSQRADLVRAELDGASKNAAYVIARTESVNAYNAGAVASWKDSSVVTGKRWLESSEPCPFCDSLDGVVVGIDEDFLKAGTVLRAGGKSMTLTRNVPHPALHPHCRCGIEPVFQGNA